MIDTHRPVVPLEQALDLAVSLLGEIASGAPKQEYYGRLCSAVCRFSRMDRAGIWLYDAGRHEVSLVGAHGLDAEELGAYDLTVETTPIARRALEEDRVIESSENLDQEVPVGLAGALGLTTLTCTPLSAAGQWYGVLVADRNGARFALTDTERHLLHLSGKVLGLAASTRIAVRQTERARRLSDRLNLSRELHERVLQRLFGVSLVLGSGGELSADARQRCAEEIAEATTELRTTLQRPPQPPRATGRTLREELDRLPSHRPPLPVSVTWADGAYVPPHAEALAQTVLAEALRNVRKHAAPTRVEVEVGARDGAWFIEVRNDGAREGTRGAAMGLRLAAFDALEHGGVVEFGPHRRGEWRVRLVLPGAP